MVFLVLWSLGGSHRCAKLSPYDRQRKLGLANGYRHTRTPLAFNGAEGNQE
jgi:hypothetical protein